MYKLLLFLLILTISVSSVSAQEPRSVAVDGVRFDVIAAESVDIVPYFGGSDTFPPEAPHINALFHNETPPTGSLFEGAGGIRIYRTEDFVGYPNHEQLLHDLQVLLDEGGDLSDTYIPDGYLPFSPFLVAAQVLRTRASYVEGESFRGISYLTIWQETAEPILRHDNKLLYTFQGISSDGAYYVSAIFPVASDIFPVALDSTFDYGDFVDRLPEYLAMHTTWLNDAEADSFSPSLNVLDAQIASLRMD